MRVYFMCGHLARSISTNPSLAQMLFDELQMRGEVEHERMPFAIALARDDVNRAEVNDRLRAAERAHDGADDPAMRDDQYALVLCAPRRVDHLEHRREAELDAFGERRAALALRIRI